MENVFLKWVKKDKFIFGVVLSLTTSIIVIVTALDFAEVIKTDLLYLPITAGLFLALFMLYVWIVEENGL